MNVNQAQASVAADEGSFCIPRTAIEALLEAKATAYEICAYLTLACHTDHSGRFSTANIAAINKATGANKTRNGIISKALTRVREIRAQRIATVSNGRSGRSHAMVRQTQDLGPILLERKAWQEKNPGADLPDGPVIRSKVLNVLPDFDEPMHERVWISRAIVGGTPSMTSPLKKLKNAGDEAARLLLVLCKANDMGTWGGVRPVGAESGPWQSYEAIQYVDLGANARMILATAKSTISCIDKRICGDEKQSFWDALAVLQSLGFIYEMPMVLNRSPKDDKLSTGAEFKTIRDDAEPLFELGRLDQSESERGVGDATKRVAQAYGHQINPGQLVAIVAKGQGAMIVGVFRLRFRVNNEKNAGVKNAHTRITEGNQDAERFLEQLTQRRG